LRLLYYIVVKKSTIQKQSGAVAIVAAPTALCYN